MDSREKQDELEILIEKYRRSLQQYRNDLSDALATGDREQLRMAGHRLKGSGKPYGFPDISEAGAALEAAAKEPATSDLQLADNVEALRAVLAQHAL